VVGHGRFVPALVLGWVWLLAPAAARAYCRTTTAKEAQTSCPETCVTGGVPLAWQTPDLHYSLDQAGFPELDESEVGDALAASFGTWEDVSCDGESIGFEILLDPEPSLVDVGPESRTPAGNINSIIHFTAEEWSDRDLGFGAFAVTAVWYKRSTGEIVGADMQFNGAMDPFLVCPDQGCPRGQKITDLPNVVTHEAGHFLGLAHSDDPSATMWCGADNGEVSKRQLGADDVDGLCDAYPPGTAFRDKTSIIYSQSCALGRGASDSCDLTLGLLLALLGGRASLTRRRALSTLSAQDAR
jgi:hypothetical protein